MYFVCLMTNVKVTILEGVTVRAVTGRLSPGEVKILLSESKQRYLFSVEK